jgi:hypothetical protein
MARMFPLEPRKSTNSNAEMNLFKGFKEQLPDEYLVFYSVAWQFRDIRRGNVGREIDFLIIKPYSGFLVLEVKGGKPVYYDGVRDEWFSSGNKITDPIRQSKEAKHSFQEKLKELFGGNNFYCVDSAVAFPDVEMDEDFRLDLPREYVLDSRDCYNLKNWVENAFNFSSTNNHCSTLYLNEDFLAKLADILCPARELSQPHSDYFAKLDQAIGKLTEEQFGVIDYLQRHRQLAISGSAGSGKTIIAVEKALRLDREGFNVLLLCFNPYLAASIQARVKNSGVLVSDFKSFVHYVLTDSPDQFELNSFIKNKSSESWSQFEKPSPKDIVLALDRLSTFPKKFDAVIVDEGQDFEVEWWDLVSLCLNDPENGILYIFFDDHQRIGRVDISLKYLINHPPIDLSENCRNAGEIYGLVKQLFPHAPSSNSRLEDKGVVEEWVYSSEGEMVKHVRSSLAKAEEYSPGLKDIVVITAEACDIKKSKFNGMILDTPHLKTLPELGTINWKYHVLRYLNKYGLYEHGLSNEPMPNKKDVQKVVDLCRKRIGNSPQPPFHWHMDIYGSLSIHAANNKPVVEKDEILTFFGNSQWVQTLPAPYKRYRFTTISDSSNHPEYYNIRLVDIPSFKGLDAEGIIFIYYDVFAIDDYQLKSSLYVALSRAKSFLYIISPTRMREEIQRLKRVTE